MLKKLIVGVIVVNFVFMLASLVVPTVAKYRDTAIAQNTTVVYLASATVPEQLEMNAVLYKMLPDGSDIDFPSGPQSSLDFGTLSAVTDTNDTILYMGGNTSYAVVMYPATSGRQYRVLFSGEPLTGSGGGSIGDGADGASGSTQDAYLVVPDYQQADKLGANPQGAIPAGASVGLVGRVASSSNHQLYTSGPGGFTRAVRAYFGIGGPPATGDIQSCSAGHDGSGNCLGTPQVFNEGSTFDLVQPDQPAGDYSGEITFTLTL